jgi:hypothetical protein
VLVELCSLWRHWGVCVCVCVCVCECVCERERETETETEIDRDRERICPGTFFQLLQPQGRKGYLLLPMSVYHCFPLTYICLCIQILPFWRDTSHISLELPLFYFVTSVKTQFPVKVTFKVLGIKTPTSFWRVYNSTYSDVFHRLELYSDFL